MYRTRVTGDALFEVTSSGYGQPITTYGVTDRGETPMSLVTIALASCVTMCVQGYFAKVQGQKNIRVETDCLHREGQFELVVKLDQLLTTEIEEALEAYIDERCRVKQLLRSDLEVKLTLETV